MKTTALRGVVDDGTREIPLVNKYGKLICNIYIRPADCLSLLDRYEALMGDFENIIKPLAEIDIKADGSAAYDAGREVLRGVEAELKRRINELFDMEEADDIFSKRNPFSSVGGEFFVTRVLQALGDVVVAAVKEEAALSQQHTEKYLTDKTPKPKKKAGGDNAGPVAEDPTN